MPSATNAIPAIISRDPTLDDVRLLPLPEEQTVMK